MCRFVAYLGSYEGNALAKQLATAHGPYKAVLVSSEKLTDFNSDWRDVPVNNLLLVDEDHHIELLSFKL